MFNDKKADVTKGYLVCSLDDENYAYPEFEFCDTLEKAKEISLKNVKNWVSDYCEPHFSTHMCFEEIQRWNTNELLGYRYDYKKNNSFFVNYIIPCEYGVEISFVVYHHAYDGVEFAIEFSGTNSECIEFMQRAAKEAYYSYSDIPDDYVEFENVSSICFDTGHEWDMWSVVNVK